METFNITSYASGRIRKTIVAKSMEDAKKQLEEKGYDFQNDYFLETVVEATSHFIKATRYAENENIIQQADKNDTDYLIFKYKN